MSLSHGRSGAQIRITQTILQAYSPSFLFITTLEIVVTIFYRILWQDMSLLTIDRGALIVDVRLCCRLSGHVMLVSSWSFPLLRVRLRVEPGQAALPRQLGRRQLSQWHR